jgi:DNA processing protein
MSRDFILHLSLIENIGPATVKRIVDSMRSDVTASDLYSFSVQNWINFVGLTEAVAQKIVDGLSNTKVLEAELLLIERHAVKWVTILDDEYPLLLGQIYSPPPVLYWYGGSFDDTKKHIAIVGSRAVNLYGERVTKTLVPDLVAADVVIVSGGALGVDALSHDATLQAGGKTIAVLGSGLLNMYPARNKPLFKKIIDSGGLVLSSFPLLMEPLPGNFPARNRIIAGLSHGSLVVQAAQKSGALITAHYALEQGRDVFAVPGAIDDALSAGCHELIQNGAKLVTCAADIVEECAMNIHKSVVRDIQTTLHDAQQLIQKNSTQSIVEKVDDAYSDLSDIQKKIVYACKQSASLDDIIQATDLSMSVVQSELFNLQLDGKVMQDFIGMWKTII